LLAPISRRAKIPEDGRFAALSLLSPVEARFAQVAKLLAPISRRAKIPEDGRFAALSLLSKIGC
jgi:hypothetical protein